MTDKTNYQLGILGYPLGHSLSAVFQPLYLQYAGLSGDYTPQEVSPEDLAGWIAREKHEKRLHGFNVTIPHKVQILPSLETFSDEVRLIGAANTVCITTMGWHGENTDAFGFMAPIDSERRRGLREAHILVIGAGGASRAIAYGLLKERPRKMTFWVRSLARAELTRRVINRMNTALTEGKTSIEWTETLPDETLQEATWVINTSPVGMQPNFDASPLTSDQVLTLPADALVYDLVYNPLETRLLRMARERQLTVQDGLDMLIWQGARSFSLWTGVVLSDQVIADARAAVLSRL